MERERWRMTAKIIVYAFIVALGITILAVLFIRDWRKNGR